ncbi:hypothetical protein IQ215_13725 [Cyanobacterium stanieri LEGE 03274]|uniref:Uncharacterized protein n=1 Tax=Cyanobacterium stanieri LEGE 03274 TaxID=1828756 RepID=A0ABR9V7A4_9CHRO|nr:hypothetical protein [Cyanobacterium stanieri]MBE9223758.1 hypothetical protein [Cyanobacterium stanieri LEGE 03274]
MSNENRNYAVNFKVDNLTKKEAEKLESECVNKKREIAPQGRGTSVVGESKKLSGKKAKEITGEG